MSEPISITDYFTRRLDDHLATLPSDKAKRTFLQMQLLDWEGRYADFERTQGRNAKPHPKFGVPTAFDYTETIAVIAVKLGAIKHTTTKGDA